MRVGGRNGAFPSSPRRDYHETLDDLAAWFARLWLAGGCDCAGLRPAPSCGADPDVTIGVAEPDRIAAALQPRPLPAAALQPRALPAARDRPQPAPNLVSLPYAS